MTRAEFLSATETAGIDERSFDLDGGHPPERYVLSEAGAGRWSVYYSERGLESGLRVFNWEGEALDYLLAMLLHDSTTHKAGWPK